MTLAATALGTPRLHLRTIDSTNLRARALAGAGAPHGTLVTAAVQSAGRGRQGRDWTAPPHTSLLMSLVLRDPPALLTLRAGAAVADTVTALLDQREGGDQAGRVAVKWPNDVLLDGRKVAGILAEGRPQDHWAVLGIGLNVALELTQLPDELRSRAATLGLDRAALEPALAALLRALSHRLGEPVDGVLGAVRARDALRGRAISWDGGEGIAAGIDDDGRLLVESQGEILALDAGEVHLAMARTSSADR